MDSIAEFISQKEQIANLESKLKKSYDSTSYWRKQHSKLKDSKPSTKQIKTLNVLIRLKDDGRLNMTDEEIANECFVDIKTVYKIRSVLKNA